MTVQTDLQYVQNARKPTFPKTLDGVGYGRVGQARETA